MMNLGVHRWEEFVARAATRATLPCLPGADPDSQAESDSGGVSFAGAIRMAQQGWPQGAQQVSSALDSLPPESEALPGWNMDVAGAICCAPAFIAGDPECMFRLDPTSRPERRLTLVVPGSYSGAVGSTAAMNYAIAVAAIVRSLEASGVSVAVINFGCRAGTSSKIESAYAVYVREHGEPLDLAKIAFAFHPAWLRKIDWAWRERTPEAIRAGIANSSRGLPRDYTSETVRSILDCDPGVLAITPSLSHNSYSCDTVESAVKLIRTSVQKYIEELVS